MKKILTNKIYLTMITGCLISLIMTIITLFITYKNTFTGVFIANISINFIVTAIIILSKNSFVFNFRSVILYLFITLALLMIDVTIISNTLDLNVYSNLMYIKNIEMYLVLYSIFVLIMSLLAIYSILKINQKNTVRQKVTKQ